MSGATAIINQYHQAQSTASKDKQRGIEMYNQIGKYFFFADSCTCFNSLLVVNFNLVYSNVTESHPSNEEIIRIKEQAIIELGTLLARAGKPSGKSWTWHEKDVFY